VSGNGPQILICYDGSDGARTALETAARLFPEREAVVASYWQPFGEASKRLSINILELIQDPAAINVREEQIARDVAQEGAGIAQGLGLIAEPQTISIEGPIDEAILAHADEIEAAAIVLGSRSHSGLKSLILGDVANEVVQRADRPVVVAPSPELARRRRAASSADVRA
jgi:nucleotide-binding universal stress UspA family protein